MTILSETNDSHPCCCRNFSFSATNQPLSKNHCVNHCINRFCTENIAKTCSKLQHNKGPGIIVKCLLPLKPSVKSYLNCLTTITCMNWLCELEALETQMPRNYEFAILVANFRKANILSEANWSGRDDWFIVTCDGTEIGRGMLQVLYRDVQGL